MRLFRLAIVSVFAISAGAIASVSIDPEIQWRAEIASANQAWAGTRHAILKIDDAVYLKDGQSAYLTRVKGGYKWVLTKPEGLVPTIKYANEKALVRMLGAEGDLDLLTQKGNMLALSETVDLKAQVTQIEPGQQGLRVMVYNQANPAPAKFTGLEYYPYSKTFAVTAKFAAAASPVQEDFQTSRGWWKRFYRVGDAVFSLNGKEHKLPFYASTNKPADIDSISAFFMDSLTGKETYGVGRYIDIPVKGGLPATLTIDFNYAYNPNCARSAHYNCPQAKVTLSAEMRAGERKPKALPGH